MSILRKNNVSFMIRTPPVEWGYWGESKGGRSPLDGEQFQQDERNVRYATTAIKRQSMNCLYIRQTQ